VFLLDVLYSPVEDLVREACKKINGRRFCHDVVGDDCAG
jgi:hypothetical protein